jgi:hypothetical protein
MNRTNLLVAILVSAGMALGTVAQAKEKKHEEENVSSSDVPAAVQQAAESEAKGGKILRWEKEGRHYEAIIEQNGKEWGVVINDKGKVLNKHDESKEKGQKHKKD